MEDVRNSEAVIIKVCDRACASRISNLVSAHGTMNKYNKVHMLARTRRRKAESCPKRT